MWELPFSDYQQSYNCSHHASVGFSVQNRAKRIRMDPQAVTSVLTRSKRFDIGAFSELDSLVDT